EQLNRQIALRKNFQSEQIFNVSSNIPVLSKTVRLINEPWCGNVSPRKYPKLIGWSYFFIHSLDVSTITRSPYIISVPSRNGITDSKVFESSSSSPEFKNNT